MTEVVTSTEDDVPTLPGGDDRQGGDGGDSADVRLPSLGPVGWLRWAWRQLTSMRTALLLLLLLAVAAVPGSVFPQRRIDPGLVATYLDDHPSLGPWLDRLSLFDVYTSPWFSAIYLLLFVSLVGCVLPRSRVHWRAMRSAPPRTPRRLERLPAHTSLTLDAVTAGGTAPSHEAVLAAARDVLRRRRYRIADYDASVSAERGYLAETGNLVFHLALLGLLVAIAAGSYVGYSGQAVVVEGRSFANVLPSYDSFSSGRLVDTGDLPPFSMTLNSLAVQFEAQAGGSQLGAPRRFDAHMTVKDTPTSPTRTFTISPNTPLDIRGTRVFLVGNGYAPIVTIKDGNGTVAFRGPVPSLPRDGNYTSVIVVKAPDAKPRQIGLTGLFLPTFQFDPKNGLVSIFPDAIDPRLVLTAFASEPGKDGMGVDVGIPQSVYRLDVTNMTQLTSPNGDKARLLLAPGTTVDLPQGAGSVTFEGVRRYAAFDFRYDPTKGYALGSAMLALFGVTASLFIRRRRLWVRVRSDDAGRTVVEVAGLAKGDDAQLGAEVGSLAQEIAKNAGTKE